MRPARAAGSVISFRLSATLASALAAEAKKYGISPHEMARECVLQRLLDESEDALGNAVAELEKEVQKLRADVKLAVVALLCDAGKVEIADAEAWVNNHLFE